MAYFGWLRLVLYYSKQMESIGDTVDGTRPANLLSMQTLGKMRYFPYQLVSRISEPINSTDHFLCFFVGKAFWPPPKHWLKLHNVLGIQLCSIQTFRLASLSFVENDVLQRSTKKLRELNLQWLHHLAVGHVWYIYLHEHLILRLNQLANIPVP